MGFCRQPPQLKRLQPLLQQLPAPGVWAAPLRGRRLRAWRYLPRKIRWFSQWSSGTFCLLQPPASILCMFVRQLGYSEDPRIGLRIAATSSASDGVSHIAGMTVPWPGEWSAYDVHGELWTFDLEKIPWSVVNDVNAMFIYYQPIHPSLWVIFLSSLQLSQQKRSLTVLIDMDIGEMHSEVVHASAASWQGVLQTSKVT